MKYIAFYDVPDIRSENRYVNAAARGVIDYMIDAFSSVSFVEVISPGRTLHSKGVYRGKTINITERAILKLPFTFGVKTKIGRIVSLIWSQLWLFFYLFFHTKRGEKVVFYHSLSLMLLISVLAKIKGIQPVLEFREIYSDINKVSKRLTKREHKYFKCAYAFVFPSDAIRKILGINNKPYVLAPGAYFVHDYGKQSFGDGKIHAVYAGNLRKDKGGAYLAVDAAEFLSEDYKIHILSGSASPNSIVELQKEIDKVSLRTDCQIAFEGAMYGEEFYRFLNKCDVGLATQNNGDFSNTSFPSKILTYLGCGLSVVAPPIDAVRLSPVSDLVNEYASFDPKDVAKSIMNCFGDCHQINTKQSIKELDINLKEELRQILL